MRRPLFGHSFDGLPQNYGSPGEFAKEASFWDAGCVNFHIGTEWIWDTSKLRELVRLGNLATHVPVSELRLSPYQTSKDYVVQQNIGVSPEVTAKLTL